MIVLALCLLVPYVCARMAGLDVGYAVGMYAGSQTISASIGVATDQMNRLGVPPQQLKVWLDAIPVGYAVTYIYGTIGSAIVLAQLGPKLLGIDLPKACTEYEKQLGGGDNTYDPGVFSAYRQVDVRAYRITAASGLTGKPVHVLFPDLRIISSGSAAAVGSLRRMPTRCSRTATSRQSRGRGRCWWRMSRPWCRRSTTRACSTCR